MKVSGPLVGVAVVSLIAGSALTGAFIYATSNDAVTPAAPAGPARGGGYAPTVATTIAKEAAIEKTIDVLGEARALKSVAITSETTGLVVGVNVAPGVRVREGDILLQLDDEEQKIAVDRARAQYPIAKTNAERYRQLADENAGSALEAEDAYNALRTLEAELRSAEFALDQRTIRAPFDGIAGITTIEAGDYLRAGDSITTLDDTSSIVIEFSVPQESAAYVVFGQEVIARITSDAGVAHKGKVTAIDSRIDPASRTLRVEATVDNNKGLLLPGAVFAVSTTSAGAPAVSVPGLALQWDRAGAYLWKRGADGKAVRASVRILQRTDDIVLVEGDVMPGDVVATDGADRVRDGVPLQAADQETLETSARGVASASGR